MNTFTAKISGSRYGQLTVLGDVTMTVESGGMLVLLGSNGAGKTTTLRSLVAVVDTAYREVHLNGKNLSGLPSWCLPSEGIVLVPDGARCFPNVSVYDNLRGTFAATHQRVDGAEFKRLYDEVISFFPILGQRAQQISGTMSGGQRQMLAVGRALMAEPRVLLLDEPSAGLAPIIVEELFETLGKIKHERGCSVILAEQNAGYATQFAGDCIVLAEGKVVLSGPMNTVLSDERLRTAYLGL
ncbi:ABC transporter ATP-binding protein [Paralcaligenes ureilyticus]|uniref:Branched-chain amino acid transport system ATP-binding protein n=1 Tax=Paralcaligenes ureilyticus TaxID=627131 RepID=A0A4R3LW75_9BURK|nr:ABC transporter ATP-binding protein [Paralcaligenes ureilyticus]TCT04823.1 branched-chain amino acid transport system ATP-binding protein [Paralcaligenes ureilyticus]